MLLLDELNSVVREDSNDPKHLLLRSFGEYSSESSNLTTFKTNGDVSQLSHLLAFGNGQYLSPDAGEMLELSPLVTCASDREPPGNGVIDSGTSSDQDCVWWSTDPVPQRPARFGVCHCPECETVPEQTVTVVWAAPGVARCRPQQVDPCERPVDEAERAETAAAAAMLVDAASLCSAVQLEPPLAGALFEPGDWRREAERAAPRQEVVRRLTLTSSLPPPAAHERRYVEELRPAGGAAPPGPDRRHRARVTRYSRGRARHETSVVYVLGLNLSTWCCVPAGRLVGSLRSNPDFPLLSRRAWASISAALVKRHVRRSKSMISVILFGDETSADDVKTKNIRQTEILVDLREAIQQLGRHFQSVDPELSGVSLLPDYSMESHARDHDAFVSVSSKRQRRAKALLDFERHDDDELGFRKNDVITVLSQRDEHCWVGELNGLRGWFPAKFVELLDERSKMYSSAGDDSVTEAVTHLVRGSLCATLKQVLEHGMRRPIILGGVCHPWLFIEEVAHKEVERDYNSVYSRLVLCKTYRLDEDGKVLSPEELLYRCVEAVNLSHDRVHAQMDVKLRSLICMGLNEQVLHLWLEAICSNTAVVQKWYQPWSFMSSPGWVQVKCELRVLAQFSFRLNPDWELPAKKNRQQPLREGVQDMLVKHHLFSWDL